MSLIVLSKAAPPRIAAPRRSVGRPVTAETEAIEATVIRLEQTETWQRVHRLGQITHYAGTYDRPDWAQQAGAELVSLAAKQLDMLRESGGNAS